MFSIRKKTILIILTAIVALAVSGIAGSEYYASRPQFCGLCHTMEKPNDFWIKSGHEDVKCVDCHYITGKGGFLKSKFKEAGQVFTHFSTYAKAEVVKKPLQFKKTGCSASNCHQREKLVDKKAGFTEDVPFTHKPHKDKVIKGQSLRCNTCHSEVKAEKSLEAAEEACYLCYGLFHISEVFFSNN